MLTVRIVRRRTALVACVALLGLSSRADAYSVLTHEAIVDAAWQTSIVPVLRARFHPSRDALRRAKAFAYGGSMIQDIGYYPLSGVLFGQLAHYARTGHFVLALIRESRTVDEEAFALGALSHYVADVEGHQDAVNPSVPLTYPKLAAAFGPLMTYEDDPTAHLRTEFGFDVLQVARGAYLPQSYRDFIGFEIPRPLLERAFEATYGLTLDDVLPHYTLSVGTFRHAVSDVIPAMTKVAWSMKQDDIRKRFPDATSRAFVFQLTSADFERRWGREYSRPNVWQKILAWLFRLVPKIGPFRVLSFRPPTRETERLFVESFDRTVARYRVSLDQVAKGRPALADVNLDTGQPIRPGEYGLVDEAYAKWLGKLDEDGYARASAGVRSEILSFYAERGAPIATKADDSDWRKVTRELSALRRAR